MLPQNTALPIELQAPQGERRVELRTDSLQNYCSTIELFTRYQQLNSNQKNVPNWTRTNNLTINSRSLYQLSYRDNQKKYHKLNTTGGVGLEPTSKILETPVLPLNYPPTNNTNMSQYPLSDLNRYSKKEIDFESTASTIPPNERSSSKYNQYKKAKKQQQKEWDSNPCYQNGKCFSKAPL